MTLLARSAVSDEPQLVAELEQARGELRQIEAEASAAVAAAQGQVTAAQGRVDDFWRGLIREHVSAWREHAEMLRRQSETVGDETVVTSVRVYGGVGSSGDLEPLLRFKRTLLLEEADQADQRAEWLSNQLLRDPDSALLARVVGELEPLPTQS